MHLLPSIQQERKNDLAIFFLMLGVLAVAAARAQPQQPPIPKGLLARLVEIKYTSELYLSTALKEGGSEKDSAMAIYNTLRWKVDGFVYQLSGDLVVANSPRKMRLLNEWCLKKSNPITSIQTYTEVFLDIENLYQKQIVAKMYASSRTVNLSTNVFYLLKDSYTIVKGLSDLKTQKTMAIIELLDHTRLLTPGEIAKQGK